MCGKELSPLLKEHGWFTGYLDMSCRRGVDVEEAYDEGRIAPVGEDDYMLTDMTGQVEEVAEEEDVTAKPGEFCFSFVWCLSLYYKVPCFKNLKNPARVAQW